MPTNRLALLACAVAICAPVAASAQTALTTGWANLRAGPGPEYPLVAQLPPHASVSLLGCLSNYTWCDVASPGEWRGWVYAGSLVYPDNSGPLLIINSGPSIGLPIVSFTLGSYWGNYYRERPWYRDRDRWDSWHRHHRERPEIRPPHYRSDVRPERPSRPSHDAVRPDPVPPREVRPPRPHDDARPVRPSGEVRPPVQRHGETRLPQARRDDRGESRTPEAPR